MGEYAGDVEPVGARHTILAPGAGHRWIFEHGLRGVFKQGEFVVAARVERSVGADVILQMFHIGHAAEHCEHTREGGGKAESPRRDALLRAVLLEAGVEIVGERRQAASEQWFHHHYGDAALVQLVVEVIGIVINARGVAVIDIIQLNLHEIPMKFVVARQQVVESLDVAVIGEAEVADAPCFALLHQKIEQIVVDEALHEGGKPLADAYDVQQIVVDVVGLQFHKRIAIHFHRGVEHLLRRQPFARHAMVRHLGGYIIGVAGVALQRDSGCLFRQSAAIRRSGVEIVDAVR